MFKYIELVLLVVFVPKVIRSASAPTKVIVNGQAIEITFVRDGEYVSGSQSNRDDFGRPLPKLGPAACSSLQGPECSFMSPFDISEIPSLEGVIENFIEQMHKTLETVDGELDEDGEELSGEEAEDGSNVLKLPSGFGKIYQRKKSSKSTESQKIEEFLKHRSIPPEIAEYFKEFAAQIEDGDVEYQAFILDTDGEDEETIEQIINEVLKEGLGEDEDGIKGRFNTFVMDANGAREINKDGKDGAKYVTVEKFLRDAFGEEMSDINDAPNGETVQMTETDEQHNAKANTDGEDETKNDDK